MYSSKHIIAAGSRKYLSLCVILLTGGLAFSAAEAAVYDFENLEIDHGIQSTDGWVRVPDGGFMITRLDDTPENGTQVAMPFVGVDSGWHAYLSRVNNETFSFSPFFGTETQAVMQFDTTAEAVTGFGLGTDLDGNGLITPEAGELGPLFGAVRDYQRGVEQFAVVTANFGFLYATPLNSDERCCNADSDWYRLQLRMDLTANGGAGSGSLYYMNLTRGDSGFQPVAELQNLDLGLDSLGPSAGPESWNTMWMGTRFEGALSVPRMDNLVPRIAIVMQPDQDLSIQGVDGTDCFDATFGVTLRVVEDPSEASGLVWRLSQFLVADPGTPPSSVLQCDMDLMLDAVDVSAVYPDLGTVPGACLEFQGWDEADVTTMTWKYVADGCQ